MSNRIFNVMDTSLEKFDATVHTYLQKMLNNLNIQYSDSQLFTVIFNGIKGVMQNAMFYIEDALTEQNIETASRKKSVYSLAKVSGYEPFYGSTATGTLVAKTLVNNGLTTTATKVYIDNRDIVINKSTGMQYLIILNSNKYVIDISAPLCVHEFKIIEGTYNTATYVSTGEALEHISINFSGLFDREYLTVKVNGIEWTQVASLYDMYKDSTTYMINVGYNNTFDVTFGNGIYGKIPENGATITVEFLIHSGTIGNVGINETSNFVFKSNGYDSFGNAVNLNDYIILTPKNVVSGGTQSDSIEFVRNMIGCNSRSSVLASEDNFRLFFKRFSFIGSVHCWSDINSMIINAVCTTNVINNIKEYNDYYAIKPEDVILSDNHKAMILNTLNNSNKAWAGITLNLEDPTVRRYAIMVYLKTKNVYSRSIVEQNIKDALAYYFTNLEDNITFIAKSDLVTAALTSNTEIESLDIDIISNTAEECFKNGYYYEYELKLVNDKYTYVAKKIIYEPDVTPGLDIFGNISLQSNFDFPMLNGGFKYYPNKDNMDKDTCVTVNAIQFMYI